MGLFERFLQKIEERPPEVRVHGVKPAVEATL